MKKVLFVSMLCMASLSFAADAVKLGESLPGSDVCNQKEMTDCEDCVRKNCPQLLKTGRTGGDKGSSGSTKSSSEKGQIGQ